jgi:hypothetical protein
MVKNRAKMVKNRGERESERETYKRWSTTGERESGRPIKDGQQQGRVRAHKTT